MSPAQITTDRCDLHVVREDEQYYRLTCSCDALLRAYSTRAAATQAAVRHGNESGRGYSVTNR